MSQTTLTTFRRFADLPLELRQEVWNLDMPRPRVVELSWLSRDQIKPVAYCSGKLVGRPKHSSELAQVTREARYEYLQQYRHISLVDVQASDELDGRPRLSSVLKYFNSKIDTLFISKTPSWHLLENTLIREATTISREASFLGFLGLARWQTLHQKVS